MPLRIKVNGINEGDVIPKDYTCDGKNHSPEIEIAGTPTGTQSLALIVEDPDAPGGTFVHWVMYNIGPNVSRIQEKLERSERTSDGFIQGGNDFGRTGYDGPCPPRGHGFHRYFFKLYALSSSLNIPGTATREKLLKSMEGKILEEAQAMGRYRR